MRSFWSLVMIASLRSSSPFSFSKRTFSSLTFLRRTFSASCLAICERSVASFPL